ncbi:MAG: alanyl-tRNA editing protein [Spirochaetota bacterium]
MDASLLYYQDAYRTRFSAEVLSVEDRDGKSWAVLDRTAFYPEGGGQPGDRGRIGEAAVLGTRKEGGTVLHLLDRRLSPGRFECEIDWDYRFDYMQQHTGQHIVSGCLYRNHRISTVAIHLGEGITTIETDLPEIDDTVLEAVEEESNDLIRRHLPVSTEWRNEEDIPPGELRRAPTQHGTIRIVSIGDFDRVACGGVHTATTAEVGLIKLAATETVRGRIRTIWKMGNRAYEDYRMKHRTVSALGTLLSCPPEEVLDRTRQLEERLRSAEYRRREFELELTRRRAEELAERAEPLERAEGPADGEIRVLGAVVEDPHVDFSELMKLLSEKGGLVAVIVCPGERSVQWGIADGGASVIDGDRLREELLAPFSAKGGGKAPIWRGMLPRREDGESFVERGVEVFFGKSR